MSRTFFIKTFLLSVLSGLCSHQFHFVYAQGLEKDRIDYLREQDKISKNIFRLDAPQLSMEHVQVAKQEGLANCYSCAIASLIDAWRFSHGDSDYAHQTSAVKLALDTLKKGWLTEAKAGLEISRRELADVSRLPKLLPDLSLLQSQSQPQPKADFIKKQSAEGSEEVEEYFDLDQEKLAFKAYLQYGSCSSSDETELYQYSENMRYSRTVGLRVLMNFVRQTLDIKNTQKRLEYLRQFDHPVCFAHFQEGVEVVHSNLESQQLNSIRLSLAVALEAFENDEDYQVLAHLFEKSCAIKKPIQSDLKIDSVTYNHDQDFIQEINQHLDRAKNAKSPREAQPIGIVYCSKVLESGRNYQGIIRRGSRLFTGKYYVRRVDCGLHDSVVIGKRERMGQTEFLIQNSWGKSCEGISPDWECENGKIWIAASELAKNSTGLFWLEAS